MAGARRPRSDTTTDEDPETAPRTPQALTRLPEEPPCSNRETAPLDPGAFNEWHLFQTGPPDVRTGHRLRGALSEGLLEQTQKLFGGSLRAHKQTFVLLASDIAAPFASVVRIKLKGAVL